MCEIMEDCPLIAGDTCFLGCEKGSTVDYEQIHLETIIEESEDE